MHIFYSAVTRKTEAQADVGVVQRVRLASQIFDNASFREVGRVHDDGTMPDDFWLVRERKPYSNAAVLTAKVLQLLVKAVRERNVEAGVVVT